MTWRIASLAIASPSVGPYCSAAAVEVAATRDMIAAKLSAGKVEVSGSPPASEMTSGRSVIAIRSRIAEDFIARVRDANRPVYRSSSCAAARWGRRERGMLCVLRRRDLRTCGLSWSPGTVPMKLVLDILQGLGLASAAGLRPFLPALLAGALASGDVGLDFDGTQFAFLESPIWLLALVIALIASVFIRPLLEQPAGEAALSGIGIGLGALLCAASIDDRHATWWYGLIIGAAFAYLASTVSRAIFGRVRARFASAGDSQAAAALPFYGEAAAWPSRARASLFPPLALVAVGFLIALLVTGRRRGDQKYAGLRILR